MSELPGEATAEAELTAVLDTSEAGPRAIRGGAFRLVGYGASAVLGVVGVAAVTRHLQTADYGRFSVVQSLAAIVTGLAELGMINIGIREYANRRGADRDEMLANLQGIRLALGVGGTALTLLFGLAAGYTGAMMAGLVLMGLTLVLTASQTTLSIPLSAGLQWGWVTGFDLIRQLGQVALYLVLAAAGAGLIPFFAAGIPVAVVVLALNGALVRRNAPLLPRFDRARWKEVGKLVAPYAASAAVASIYVYAAAVVLSLVTNAHEVGLFAASFRIYLVIAGIPSLFAGAAFPILARAARDDQARLAYATERLVGTMLIAGLWAGIMTSVLARVGIDVVAGHGYTRSVPVLEVQGIAVFSAFFTVTVGSVLVSMHRYRELIAMALVPLLVVCGVTLALGGSKGAIAGGIANAAAETTAAVLALVMLHRVGMPLGYVWRLAPRVLAAAAVASAVLLLGIDRIAAAAIITVVYGGLLLLFRAVPPELLEAARLRA